MTTLRNKSFRLRPADVEREWHQIDAAGQTLGKLAVRAARVLMGKDKPIYTPGVDSGAFVVVTNARDVAMSGAKLEKKYYRYHTGYVGGLVETRYDELLAGKPEKVIELAIRRMLPKNKVGRAMFGRLKVYAGAEHPHTAQKPQPLSV